jgi:type II secretory pathway pseudopilin PulG
MVKRRAFSLIEAVVATAVLGIALTVVIGLTSDAISSQSRAERLETAARLADEQLNMVLALGAEGYLAEIDPAGRCDPPFQDFAYDTAITSGAGGEPFRVRATITWNEGARARQFALETLIAPRLGEESDPDRKPTETLSRGTQQ